ncbi:Paraquat-inducible protein A family protein [Babesia bovis T2Bo]|uniref:Paraquat-inducible protein A family protein n=1 Tax=Babesia bovis T2Bo TaxID=484906 RepID=UPI001D9D1A4C|nr:Paraquat-inducible protein A family protein [Babesia bovis T2Bo]EDO07554.2 Paraquat-inducible protein A family protein [Babesia bovis T2Bo]
MVMNDIELQAPVNSRLSVCGIDSAESIEGAGPSDLGDEFVRVVHRASSTKVDMPAAESYQTVSSTPSIGRLFFGCENRVLTHKISPSNLFWLRVYKVVLNAGILLLAVAYSFYIIGLFEPILYLDAGELTDPDLFQPFFETLPHSLLTLYRQKAYFTVVVAGLFSVTFPFVKLFVTLAAYVTAVAHRRVQLLLFFGEHPIEKSGIRQESDGSIKYAREMLIFLKLVSKFQMVDVVVLLLNAVFLRSAVIWARPGRGMLFLIIYCLCSIAGAQMVNFAVEGEKGIFETWYAIKYAIVPEEISVFSSISAHSEDATPAKPADLPVGRQRWFVSEDFICLMACLNILCCVTLMTNENLMSVAFTMDANKKLSIDNTTMSYKEILSNLRNMDYGNVSLVVLFFLCILFPMVFSVLFIVCILGYNYCKRNKSELCKAVEIADADDGEPCLEYEWDVRCTRFVFNVCNIVSEWSCGEVVSLATIAAFTSMTTADRVKVTIPPLHTCSALLMMCAYGFSSFVLTAIFYIWNQNVKFEFSHIRIFVKYLESPNRDRIARMMSNNHFTDFVPIAPAGPLESHTNYTPNVRESRRNYFLPYIEYVRSILYSKWLSSVFFGLLTAAAVLFAISAYTLSHSAPHLNVTAVRSFMDKEIHEIFALGLKHIPNSVGHCDYMASPPPVPCMGKGPLFSTQNRIHFSLQWVSGIRTLSLKEAQYFLSLDHRMTFQFSFHIAKLEAYIQLAAVEDEGLRNMFAGVVGTQGNGFDCDVQVSMLCKNRQPQIRDLRVDHVRLNGFRVMGNLYSILNVFANIEELIGVWCTNEANRVLTSPKQVIVWRGVSFDIMELVNLIVFQNWPSKFVCPSPER